MGMFQIPHRAQVLIGLILGSCVSWSSWAQSDWPKAKPVTLLVAFAPGASTDIVARSLSQKLSEITGGNFIVENKGGAGGNIATNQVKRAAPDGYTVLVHSVAFAVNPSLYADAGYDLSLIHI
jgi:tripartite-type tricarboxylate transporter receptor subunit TctC